MSKMFCTKQKIFRPKKSVYLVSALKQELVFMKHYLCPKHMLAPDNNLEMLTNLDEAYIGKGL